MTTAVLKWEKLQLHTWDPQKLYPLTCLHRGKREHRKLCKSLAILEVAHGLQWASDAMDRKVLFSVFSLTAWYWPKNRYGDQWNRKKVPDRRWHNYRLIFDNVATKYSLKNRQHLQHWENWICTCRRLKLDSHLPPHTRIILRRIKDLSVRHDILQLLEEKAVTTLQHRGNRQRIAE